MQRSRMIVPRLCKQFLIGRAVGRKGRVMRTPAYGSALPKGWRPNGSIVFGVQMLVEDSGNIVAAASRKDAQTWGAKKY